MNEKKFECPELIIVQFANEDIIVTSALVTGGDLGDIGTETTGEKESY